MDVSNLVAGRAQLGLLDNYVLLNVYAPSGSNARYERNCFFSQDLFRAFNLYPDFHWLIGGILILFLILSMCKMGLVSETKTVLLLQTSK